MESEAVRNYLMKRGDNMSSATRKKIIDETAINKDIANFRAYKAIAESWARKILNYKEGVSQIIETNNKKEK